MNLYGKLFARFYDRSLSRTERAGLGQRRADLLAGVSGRVLEIGAGTGANLPYYTAAGIDELAMCEPEAPMREQVEAKLTEYPGLRVHVVDAPAERLPVADGSIDVVVSTLVLCTVDDPEAAVAEIARVLAPGGSLFFLEHVRSSNAGVAKWQRRIKPFWIRLGHGCRPDRDTLATIEQYLEVEQVEAGEMPKAPPIVRPLIVGRAGPKQLAALHGS